MAFIRLRKADDGFVELAGTEDGKLLAEVTVIGDDPDPSPVANAFESITVGEEAVGLTPATYGDAVRAMITVEDEPMRFRIDGGDSTSALGHLLVEGDMIVLESADDISNFSAIRADAADSVIQVTYFE